MLRSRLLATVTIAATIATATACSATDDSAEPVVPSTSSTTEAPPTPAGSLEVPALRLEAVTILEAPVAFATRPGSGDVFIGEQGGVVRRLIPDDGRSSTVTATPAGSPASTTSTTASGGETSSTTTSPVPSTTTEPPIPARGGYRLDRRPVLDISRQVRNQGEQGLLGLAFAPDGRRLYVHYTDLEGDTQVASYAMGPNGADPSTRREVLTVAQPYANHNGGQLAFGPDGYLYIGLGDGGGAGDPDGNAQDPSTVLGAVLRIDPDGIAPSGTSGSDTGSGGGAGATYTVPDDNPFVGQPGAPEVWLYGVRNPWRFSFDRDTGDLWVADVGQSEREEITVLTAADGTGRGANLGWPMFEGTLAFGDADSVMADDLVAPLVEYDHDDGACSVIGGYVYRGSLIEGLEGTYLYGDYCSPELQGVQVTDGRVSATGPLGIEVVALTAFGQDNAGELWVLSGDGGVWRIVAA